MKAFLFPGQASQDVGMGQDLYQRFPEAKALFDQADAILGFALTELCFSGPMEELSKTSVTQPAVYVHSVVAARLLAARGHSPDVVAGHSLGEYSALTAAGVLDFAEGLALVRERGRLMQEAGRERPGAMAAILGLEDDVVVRLCEEAGPVVVPANFNSPGQVVISGETEAVQRLTNRTTEFNENIRQVVKMTGLNYKKLLAANGMGENGQGGPFIPAKPDGIAASKIKVNLNDLDQHLMQAEGLQEIMAKLPFAPPLTSYRVTSRYGKRRDPINKRWASHYGIDFGGAKRTSVFVTAPGKVTYAGRKGKYGKLIEVDHGLGFKTRYGHLHKILVKRGQKVDYRTKIGLMGSTGRSTGPHLHYEITVKGKHQNPWRFIKAGRYVYKRQ